MSISRRTDYAIRVMTHLASRDGNGFTAARAIGLEQDVPPEFARAIVSELVSAGLLLSRRGAGGGVKLAKPASSITVLEVVQVVQGGFASSLCTTDPEWCARASWCPMHHKWLGVDQVVEDRLGSITIASLAAEMP